MKSFEQAIDDYKTNPDWGTFTHDENRPQGMEGWNDDDDES